jgi:hypothetical protein
MLWLATIAYITKPRQILQRVVVLSVIDGDSNSTAFLI